jgi:hypothetical protein
MPEELALAALGNGKAAEAVHDTTDVGLGLLVLEPPHPIAFRPAGCGCGPR